MYPFVKNIMPDPKKNESFASSIEKVREDLLTSLVLGGARYLSSNLFLLPLLNEVFPEEEFNSVLSIEFWPSLDIPEHIDAENESIVEPDWIITSEEYYIIGEAKFGLDLTKTQLNQEWELAEYHSKPSQKPLLLSITASLDDRHVVSDEVDWRWMKWTDCYLILRDVLEQSPDISSSDKALIYDLLESLRKSDIVPIETLNVKHLEIPNNFTLGLENQRQNFISDIADSPEIVPSKINLEY